MVCSTEPEIISVNAVNSPLSKHKDQSDIGISIHLFIPEVLKDAICIVIFLVGGAKSNSNPMYVVLSSFDK